MYSVAQPLHMLFFPYMATGHMIPMVDMAKLFAARGVKATIFTTPANALLIQPTVDRANGSNHHLYPITLTSVPFPSAAVGLPDGCENLSDVPSAELKHNFLEAVAMLRQPFDQVLKELAPDCVVTDMFLPWTLEVASEHGVPRLVFYGGNFFFHCVSDCLERHNPSLPRDVESFVLPGLPHRIEMLKSQFMDLSQAHPALLEVFKQINETRSQSYGELVNSFYELEPDYVEHYRNVIRLKAWHVGPVSLCNKDGVDMSLRGKEASVDRETCLNWLGSKTPGSTLYVCFGGWSEITTAQLREIALGLEASNHPFIWAVRNRGHEWLPEGYEERIEGRGLVIKGWAPQLLILNHPAVGGFVTHCGWNSGLEGVSSGVPMVTWPLFADQFYNERLIVDVLGIGVSIGAKVNTVRPQERRVVESVEVETAVRRLMGGGEEAKARRRRAREIGEMAKRAVEEGGSSYDDMGELITELLQRRNGVESKKPVALQSAGQAGFPLLNPEIPTL